MSFSPPCWVTNLIAFGQKSGCCVVPLWLYQGILRLNFILPYMCRIDFGKGKDSSFSFRPNSWNFLDNHNNLLNLYHGWLCLLPLLKLTQLCFSIKHRLNWCRFVFGRRIQYRYYEFTTAFDRVSSFSIFSVKNKARVEITDMKRLPVKTFLYKR